ncbi:glycosyltransferase [Alicyclobacillus tolerans]|uniref:glycosyltransferase n=1 Tax=Alicyclobacillus tolerans TaxID=90970 RepID=UPI001F320708|nr:glycosyltransferase [Alicyclobacillus tolerans]MCF8566741.1 glycosyltransferase [Alicyclobacillus tolerans]
MKKVLLMIRYLWRGGGTETYVLTLATELKRLGYSVGVFTSGGEWVSLFRQRGIRVHIQRPYRLAASALARTVQHFHYDAIHAHDSSSFLLLRNVRLARKVPVVFTVHGQYVLPQTVRKTAPFATAVVAVSPPMEQYLLRCGVPARKVHLIPNGISTRKFRPGSNQAFRQRYKIPANSFVIGYAGRFTFDKVRLSQRISKVLQQYVKEHKNAYALVAGRGSKQYVKGSRKLVVLGHVQNMQHFYRACDVVVGTARVALESLASAKPTLAVGYAKYAGLVTTANLNAAYRSNFGDHGLTRHSREPWQTSRLKGDLQFVQVNHQAVQRNTQVVSQWVHQRFSAQAMVQKIVRLYRVSHSVR